MPCLTQIPHCLTQSLITYCHASDAGRQLSNGDAGAIPIMEVMQRAALLTTTQLSPA